MAHGRSVGHVVFILTHTTQFCYSGSFEVLNVRICSRVFSRGFDIGTPVESLFARRVPLSPTGEILISNPSGNQIARLELESFLSSVYNIIISGGGFYQFGRDDKSRRTWTCKGEEKLLRISERNKRRYFISDGAEEIADGSKAWLANDYAIRVRKDADLKLVVCIFIALSVCEDETSFTPM
jgi:hypothetical protein